MQPADGADDDLDAICDRVERLDEDLTRLGRATERYCRRVDHCRYPDPQDPFVGSTADPVLLPFPPLDPPAARPRRPAWWHLPLACAIACALVVAAVLLAALA